LNNIPEHENYNCIVKTEEGKTIKVYANWLHNEKLDNWKGWTCYTGSTRLYIDKNLNIYNGECQNNFLGSTLTDFSIPESVICQRDTCTGCTDDLMTAKKINEQ
jgi:hypothetical protein